RSTLDIDLNIFVEPASVDSVVAVLGGVGVRSTLQERKTARRDGQVRVYWGITPVDLFFAYDEFHFNAARRIRMVPFGETTIPILAAEDLLVCKVVFDRRKDWIDIEQMLLLNAGEIDLDDVRRWVVAIVGDDDQRVARFDQAVREVL